LITDTNALSAFVEGDESLSRVIEDDARLAVPVIALGEYLYGIRHSRFRARYEAWVRMYLPDMDLLPVGEGTARHYAEIRSELKANGRPIPSNDMWIAALAREHTLPLVSRDHHFDAVSGLQLLTW
jgi:tRNA(fMet)-specific endonuclease VapC